MNLFHFFYNRPCPDDDGGHEKHGVALILDLLVHNGWELSKYAALCLVLCLPIVTIPLALTAFHTVVLRMLRHTAYDPWDDFKSGLRQWKRAYACGAPALLLPVALIIAFRYYFQAGNPLYLICGTLLLVWALSAVFLFPLMMETDLSPRALLKKSFSFGIARAGRAALGLCIYALFFLSSAVIPAILLPFWVVFAIVLGGLFCDCLAFEDMVKFMPDALR